MVMKVVDAAGAIVWRKSPNDPGLVEVLLVHRPNYKDWTFPKGKAENGEPIQVTAVREVEEETAMPVRLGHPLPEVTYRIRGGLKRVRYWCARATGEGDFTPNKEIDKIKWVSPRIAHKRLTYDHDVTLLEAFEDLVAKKHHKSRTLVLLRHTKAVSRQEFGDAAGDLDRPLTSAGQLRAIELTPLLAAFDVRRIVSSPAVRCTHTIEPYSAKSGARVSLDDRLTEGSTRADVARVIAAATAAKAPTVVCSHRPTFRDIYAALGITGPTLAPGQALVLHHRKGKVVSSELI